MTLSSTQWGSTVTSPSSGDFSLKSGASVIGKAKVLSTFSNDVLNYPRGSSWDIGGYEYGSVATAGASLAEAGTTPASADAVSGSSLASPITRSAKAARIGAQIAPTPKTPATTTATGDVVWLDDALPAGAQSGVEGGDAWSAVSSDPTPYSGSLARQSSIQAEAQQFFFYGATATLEVNAGDTLFAYVHLDPANPPDEVMLQ